MPIKPKTKSRKKKTEIGYSIVDRPFKTPCCDSGVWMLWQDGRMTCGICSEHRPTNATPVRERHNIRVTVRCRRCRNDISTYIAKTALDEVRYVTCTTCQIAEANLAT